MFKCEICGKEAKTNAGLLSHIRIMHKSEEVKQEKQEEVLKYSEIDDVVEELKHQNAEKERIYRENQSKLKYRNENI